LANLFLVFGHNASENEKQQLNNFKSEYKRRREKMERARRMSRSLGEILKKSLLILLVVFALVGVFFTTRSAQAYFSGTQVTCVSPYDLSIVLINGKDGLDSRVTVTSVRNFYVGQDGSVVILLEGVVDSYLP
jgi:transcriptional regulator of heat shock response